MAYLSLALTISLSISAYLTNGDNNYKLTPLVVKKDVTVTQSEIKINKYNRGAVDY